MNIYLRWGIILSIFILSLAPLIVSSSLFFPFITSKGFFFRVVMEIVFGLWLMLAWREPGYRPKWSPLLKAGVALLVILVVATAWGVNPARSFWSNFERMEGLILYLHLAAYFLVLISVFKTQRLWSWFLHTSLAVNLIIGIYALAQLFGELAIHQGSTRLDATLGNATYLAVYELFHIFFLLYLLWRPTIKNWWQRGVYLALLALDIFVLYKTATRGAILGLIGGLFITVLLLAIFSPARSTRRRLAAGTAITVVALVGLFLIFRQAEFVKRDDTLNRLASISLSEQTTISRFLIWNMSWQGFKERPILGWGPENYNLVFNKYYDPRMWNQEQWFDRSHNVIFDWLISVGLLGLLAYLSLFGFAFYLLWRRTAAVSPVDRAVFTGLLIGYFIHNIFVFDNLISYLLFLGVLAYINFLSYPSESVSLKPWPWPQVFFPIISIAVLATVYLVNVRSIAAGQTLIKAISSPYDQENLDDFQRVLSSGVLGRAEAREQLFQVAMSVNRDSATSPELKKKFVDLTEVEMKKQIAEAPDDARHHLFIGSFYAQLGRYEEALNHLNRAAELSPRKQTILLAKGEILAVLGKIDQAAEIFKMAFDLDPTINNDNFINAFAKVKLYDRVVDLWQRKVDSTPDNADFRASLGLARFYNNESAKAIEEFKKVGQLNPAYKQETERVIAEIRAGRNPYP